MLEVSLVAAFFITCLHLFRQKEVAKYKIKVFELGKLLKGH